MSSNDTNFPHQMDVFLDSPSFSAQNKPTPELLSKSIALTDQVRSQIHKKPMAKMPQTIQPSAIPQSLASKLMSCLGGVFKSSKVDPSSPDLSSRDVAYIKTPSKIYPTGSREEISSTASTTSMSEIDDLYEPTLKDYENAQKNVDLCKSIHANIRTNRPKLLPVKEKEANLAKYGYQKNRYNVPVFSKSIPLAKELLKLMNAIDTAEHFIRTKKIPENSDIAKELKQMKQLLFLEEHLQKNLRVADADSLVKEYNVISKNPDLSKWEKLCEHFNIDSTENLSKEWSALKKATQENLSSLELNFKRHQKQSLARKMLPKDS